MQGSEVIISIYLGYIIFFEAKIKEILNDKQKGKFVNEENKSIYV